MTTRLFRLAPVVLGIVLALTAAACSNKKPAGKDSPGASSPVPTGPVTVRLGYLPQLTQGTAVLGFQDGLFGKVSGATIAPTTYTTAAAEVSALTSGTLDAAYLDPNSAISAYESTNGGVKIVSGATSTGSFLMTKYFPQKIGRNLAGGTIATPEAGTADDVALRSYLAASGLNPGPGGNVKIVYESNPTILQQYAAGHLLGAWVDEQWAARLQVESGSTVFVDESTMWQSAPSQGQYATAVLVARTAFINAQPGALADLLAGQVISNLEVSTETPQIQTDVATAINTLTGAKMTDAEKLLSWSRVAFTNDPIASSVVQDAANAQHLGLIKSANISGIWDLTPLNTLLQQANPAATPIKSS